MVVESGDDPFVFITRDNLCNSAKGTFQIPLMNPDGDGSIAKATYEGGDHNEVMFDFEITEEDDRFTAKPRSGIPVYAANHMFD